MSIGQQFAFFDASEEMPSAINLISAGGLEGEEHRFTQPTMVSRHEHGISLEWMKKIKTLFDPNGILNPGKIFL